MKVLTLLLLIFSSQAFALDCEDYSPFNFYPKGKGHTLGFSLKGSEIDNTPKWLLSEEPPLKISEALQISNSAIKDLKLEFSTEFLSISLKHFNCSPIGNYYYAIEYATYNAKKQMLGSYYLLVLLNGKVVFPKSVNLEPY